ncbi:MAG: adenosylcobinamide-GDP ribazoletransferase [Bacillota bacterium]
MKSLILIIQFLTRIPIPITLDVTEEDFSKGIIFFPFVGFIIGMFTVSFYYVGYILGGSLLAAVLAVIAEVIITGGLHLDGLGDTFDGIYSNRSRDRILEIMKDSRLGTNAALAIFLTLLLKVAAIQVIHTPTIYPILLLMPVFSRFAVVTASRFSTYARSSGMGNMFIGKVSRTQFWISLWITVGFSIIYGKTLPYILVVFICSRLYVKHITGKIHGMTGDTLGALCELSEIWYLLYILLISKIWG